MGRFFTNGDPREPLPPITEQRLHGWIAMLDVDLDLAQQVLRRPLRELPVPPIGCPAVVRDGVELVPALEPLAPGEEAAVPKPVVGLRGAYARRAAKGR